MFRSGLGRPARRASGSSAQRIEGIVRYLADRLEGCTHEEAAARRVAAHPSAGEPPACEALPTGNESLPPADQTRDFATRSSEALAATGAPASTTHVDVEGEAVWLQTYTAYRLQNRTEREATDAVVDAIRRPSR